MISRRPIIILIIVAVFFLLVAALSFFYIPQEKTVGGIYNAVYFSLTLEGRDQSEKGGFNNSASVVKFI